MKKKREFLFKRVNLYVTTSTQPSNISYFWSMGSLLSLCLVIQVRLLRKILGFFLATPCVFFSLSYKEKIWRAQKKSLEFFSRKTYYIIQYVDRWVTQDKEETKREDLVDQLQNANDNKKNKSYQKARMMLTIDIRKHKIRIIKWLLERKLLIKIHSENASK